MAANKTITLRGNPTRDEFKATSTITPGDLIEPTSASTENHAQRHALEGGPASVILALENDYLGEGIDDDYDTGDVVLAGTFKSGDWVLVNILQGENVAYGDKLCSAGTGKFKVADQTPSAGAVEYPLVWAREACDLTDSSAADPVARCWCQVI